MRQQNSFGVKFLKVVLFFIAGIAVFAVVLPVIFSFFQPLITALPFEVPMNFIIADYLGVTALILAGLTLIVYAKKWMWR